MPLRLIVGRANAGKTGVVHGILIEALAASRRPVLLLPTYQDVRRAQSEFARKAPVGITVATFDGWIEDMWSSHGDGRRLVTHTVRQAVIRRAVQEARLRVLASSAKTRGFPTVLAKVAARLCNSGDDVPASESATELQGILSLYDRLLGKAGLIEPARAAALLADCPLDIGGPLGVNRFVDFSEAQERLLVSLAESTEVSVALAWEAEFPPTEALTPLVDRLVNAGAELVTCACPAEAGELSQVASRLFSLAPPCEPVRADGALELGTAAGEEAEIELVAKSVARIVASGIDPERVAVVFRDPGRRLERLRAALSASGLELNPDISVPAAETAFGRALFGLLSVAGEQGGRPEMLAYLLSPYSGADAEDVARLDGAWRRGRVANPSRLLSDAEESLPCTKEAVRAARMVAAAPVDGSSALVWKILADTLLSHGLASRNRYAGTTDSEVLMDAAAHRCVVAAVSESAQLGGEVSGQDLRTGLADAPVALGTAEKAGAIQVLDAAHARSRRFDALVLGGLTAHEFSAERPEPLAARLVEVLGGRGGTEESSAERMLFYTLVTRPRKTLVLIRQESDSQGEPVRASVFWDDVADLYARPPEEGESPGIPDSIPRHDLLLSDLSDSAPLYNEGRRELRKAVQSGIAALSRPASTAIDAGVPWTPSEQSEFSVTELEAYAQCPYKWFLSRHIRPVQLDVDLDAREAGGRAHEMLAEFYRRLQSNLGIVRVTVDALHQCLSLFDEVADEVEAARDDRQAATLAEELKMLEARSLARALIEADAEFLPGYVPTGVEMQFSYPASVKGTTATITARVDRIDEGPSGVVVTDYKYGDVHGRGSFELYMLIQVPLYARIAADSLGLPLAGGVYRSLKRGSVRGFWHRDIDGRLQTGTRIKDAADGEEVAQLVEWAEEVAADAIAGIRAGWIQAEPFHRSTCAFCPALPFCAKALS